MGTKMDPGKYDCYAKLAGDEPYFVLRAKDPVAPYLVHAWRMLRKGDLDNALSFIRQAPVIEPGDEKYLDPLSDKSKESYGVAMSMRAWYDENVEEEE